MKIAVDFDGTCVDHRYPDVGPEAPNAFHVLRELAGAGHQIILNTMRSGEELQAAVNWFKERNIPLFGVNRDPEQDKWTESPKCYANLYIDDAALGCPLRTIDGWSRPVVDWHQVSLMLVNLIEEKK